ncbi:MAG: 50S ribosomal protein L30 [Thermoplasmatales archaeon]|jgi:large subunit ribosomal protein L30|nr:50S ribosomal protein L30 [Thermoplasmatales archaeon]
MVFAIIRVRGIVNVNPDIKRTLKLLRLTKVNHCTLLEENKVYKGMLQKVKDYTTWGEIDKEILPKLMESRGMIVGDKQITEEYIKSATSYNTFEKLSQAILDNKFKYKEIPDVKPLFRLSPPKKGYEGIKRSFKNGGALGYRGKEINKLIGRMI